MDVDNDRPEQDIDMDAEGAIADDDAMMVEEPHAIEAEEHEGDEMYVEAEQSELADEMEAEPTPPVEGHERGFSFSQPAPVAATIPPPLASPTIGDPSPFTAGSLHPLPLASPGAAVSGAEDVSKETMDEEGRTGEEIASSTNADLTAIQETGHEEHYEDGAEDPDFEPEPADEDDPIEDEYAEGYEEGHGEAHGENYEEGEEASVEHTDELGEEYEGHEEEYEEGEEEYVEGKEGEEGEEGYIGGEGAEGEDAEDQEEHDEGGAVEGSPGQADVEADTENVPGHHEETDAAGPFAEGVAPPTDARGPSTVAIQANGSAQSPEHPAVADHPADDTRQDANAEEYYDGETGEHDHADDDMDDYPIDIPSLPAIVINLPSLDTRVLFSPSPNDEAAPVWLPGRVEALGEASLAKVWAAIKAELGKESPEQSGEMIITEKQMELKMGEDDVNLQSITLLELAQVHYGCGLPAPIQLYISFEPHRFITRFNAIQQEVQAQMKVLAEERFEVEVEFAGEIREGEGGEGGYFEGDEGYQNGAEEAGTWEQEPGAAEESVEADTTATRLVEDSQDERERRQAEYMRQKRERAEHTPAENGSSAEKHRRVESDHPHAEWAQSRIIQPLQTSGSRIMAPRHTPHVIADSTADTWVEESEADAAVVPDVTVPPPAPALRATTTVQDERRDDDVASRGGGDNYADEDKDTIDNTNTETDMSAMEERIRVRRFPAEDSLDGEGLTPGQGEPHAAKAEDVDEGVDLTYDAEEVVTDEIVGTDAPVEPVDVTATTEQTLDATQSPQVTPAVSVAAEDTLATPDTKLAVVTEETFEEGYVDGEDTAEGTDVDAIIDRADAVVQGAAEVVENAREARVGPGEASILDTAQLAVEEAEKELEEAKRERDALETVETADTAGDDTVTYDDESEEDDGSDGFNTFADAAIEQVMRGDGTDDDVVNEASPAVTLQGDSEPVPTASDEVVVASSINETPLSVTETGEPTFAGADAAGDLEDDDDTSLDPSTDTLSAAYLSPSAKRTYEVFRQHEADGEPDPERDALLEQVDAYADVETATKKSRSECE